MSTMPTTPVTPTTPQAPVAQGAQQPGGDINSQFDQIWGTTTPAPGAPQANTSRADEIRSLAKGTPSSDDTSGSPKTPDSNMLGESDAPDFASTLPGKIGSEINQSMGARKQAIDETTKNYADGKIGLAQAYVNNMGQILGGAFDIPMDAIKAITPQPVKNAVGGAINSTLNVLSGPLADALAKPEITTYKNAGLVAELAADNYKAAHQATDPKVKANLMALADATSQSAKKMRASADQIETSYGEDAKTAEAVSNVGMLAVGAAADGGADAGNEIADNVRTATGNRLDQYDNFIKSGDMKAEDVYSDPQAKVFKPEVAQQIVDDAHDNLTRLGKPDMANTLKSSADTSNMTAESMKGTVEDTLSGKNVPTGYEAPNSKADVAQATGGQTGGTPPAKMVPPVDEASVVDKYNRAIKPTVSGKANAGQIATANSRVVSGLKAISDNKANLEFTDSEGRVIQGETPKTIDQLSQSISQTKSSIFDKYDALAAQAGEKGVTVDGPSVAKELDPVINSKSLQLVNPRAINYAQDLQTRLVKAGSLDAKTAQSVIQHYNDSLSAFYKNPSYDTASNAAIDAMVANKFRGMLDEGITGATGEQYQALKNQYGALASMEKDVAHRAVVWARQNPSGSFVNNISNIASGAELVKGLASMNPVDITVGTTMKAVQMWQKYINNPATQIKGIFNEFDRASGGTSDSVPSDTQPPVQTSQPTPKLDKSGTSGDTSMNTPKSQTIAERQASKIPTQGGKIMNPLAVIFKKMSPAERGTMSDATDYTAGAYVPKNAKQFELDVSEIAEKYGMKGFKTFGGLTNEIGRMLEAGGYKTKK